MKKPLNIRASIFILIVACLIIGTASKAYLNKRNNNQTVSKIVPEPETRSSQLIAVETYNFFKEPYEKDWLISSDLTCESGNCEPISGGKKPTVGFLGWTALAHASMNKISRDIKFQEYAEIVVNHLYNKYGPRKYTVSSRFSLGHNITQLDELKKVFKPKDNKIDELVFLGGNDLTYRISNESSSIYPPGYVPMIVAVAARNLARFAVVLENLEDKDLIVAFAKKYNPELLIQINDINDLSRLKDLALSASKKLINQLFSDSSLNNDYCWALLAKQENALANDPNTRSNAVFYEFQNLNISSPENSKLTFNHLPTVLSCLEFANPFCAKDSTLCKERDYLADLMVNNFLDSWASRPCSDGAPGFLSLANPNECSGQAKTYSNNAHAVYLLSSFEREFRK